MNKTGVCKLQSGGLNRDLTKDGQGLHPTTGEYETLCSRRDFTDVMKGLEMGDDLGLLGCGRVGAMSLQDPNEGKREAQGYMMMEAEVEVR